MKQIDISGMSRTELEEYSAKQESTIQELSLRLQYYEDQIRLMRKKAFGPKNEHSDTDSAQISLFNEAELLADPALSEPALSDVKTVRSVKKKKKKKGAKDALLRKLPKETVECRLSAEEAVCPDCGHPLHEMKKEIRRELEVIPASVKVKETIRYVYSCRRCEAEGIRVPVLRAPAPAPLLVGSLLSPSLAAFLVCRKYENRDPLYKIEQDFLLQGLKLSRQTMANWMICLSEDYAALLYRRMREVLLRQPVLHADETPLQVLQEPGRSAERKSCMWVYCSGKDGTPVYLYRYEPSRTQEAARRFLSGWKGYLQTDGCSAYNGLGDEVIRVGCLAHARRKFYDAWKLLPKGTSLRGSSAGRGVRYCDLLCRIDGRVKKKPKKERLEYKRRWASLVLEGFFVWAEKEQKETLPQSPLGKAFCYLFNQKETLRNYLLDGVVELTNNRAERAVKPFVMGRKNWLFACTPAGAQASAVLYSLVETAKANGLKPFEYLEWVLERMRSGGRLEDSLLDSLLPWSEAVPEHCRQPEEESPDSECPAEN